MAADHCPPPDKRDKPTCSTHIMLAHGTDSEGPQARAKAYKGQGPQGPRPARAKANNCPGPQGGTPTTAQGSQRPRPSTAKTHCGEEQVERTERKPNYRGPLFKVASHSAVINAKIKKLSIRMIKFSLLEVIEFSCRSHFI